MSSFVILTQSGPPELLVEVGTPISEDPVLLSGLFKAIMSFTTEVTEAPLQVLQTKGFTIQFKQVDEHYVLIVGTDHSIVGLDTILEQIHTTIQDGYKFGWDNGTIEKHILQQLNEYVEFSSTPERYIDEAHLIPQNIIEIIKEMPSHLWELILFGILANVPFKYPKSHSMDLNRQVSTALGLFEHQVVSELDPMADHAIFIESKDKSFQISGEIMKIKDVVKKTKILKELLDLVKEERFVELKYTLEAEVSTLSQFEYTFSQADLQNPQDLEYLDTMRYIIGRHLEHYLLLRLNRKDKELVQYLQENTRQTEWMSAW